jgi:hypothetical protein
VPLGGIVPVAVGGALVSGGALVGGATVPVPVVTDGVWVGTELGDDGTDVDEVVSAGTGGVPRPADHTVGTATAMTATAAAAPSTARLRRSRRRRAMATGAKSPDTSMPPACCLSRAWSSFSWSGVVKT